MDMENRRCDALAGATPLEPPLPVEPLERLAIEMQGRENEVKELDRRVKNIDGELTLVAAQIREQADGATCPACGAPLDAQRLLERAGLPGGHQHE
jgi:hypothetical protein